MGLLKHLLCWPVTGPNFLAQYSLEKVYDLVRDELTDDTQVKEQLFELQMSLEMGEIDDEQYLEREAGLMRQLREVREWREEFGMGIAGGPVQVAGAGRVEEETEPVAGIEPGDAEIRVHLGFDEPRDR